MVRSPRRPLVVLSRRPSSQVCKSAAVRWQRLRRDSCSAFERDGVAVPVGLAAVAELSVAPLDLTGWEEWEVAPITFCFTTRQPSARSTVPSRSAPSPPSPEGSWVATAQRGHRRHQTPLYCNPYRLGMPAPRRAAQEGPSSSSWDATMPRSVPSLPLGLAPDSRQIRASDRR